MIEQGLDYSILILITGVLVLMSMLIKAGLERTILPPLVGYLILGFVLRVAAAEYPLLPQGSEEILQFLAKIGLVTLLFRVGLESELRALLKQMKQAGVALIGNIIITVAIGYATGYYLLGQSQATSLIIGTAFAATSVGVTVSIWKGAGVLKSPNGSFLVDLAELDDISAVILMALLFSVLPVLHGGMNQNSMAGLLGTTAGIFFLKFAAFAALCYLFSHYVTRPLADLFEKIEIPPEPTLTIAGTGFVIAALAGLLGFSLAIGAFFAGLVFSKISEQLKIESAYLPLYDFFTPFFFIGIGFEVNPDVAGSAVGLGVILLALASLAKILAVGLPVYFMKDWKSAFLLGVSMIPRAEIAMVIIQQGLKLGKWAVPANIYGGMVVTAGLTCLLSPIAVHVLLKRWPQNREGK
jgi:Kef-type K+ transport system membrane component KefB